MIGRTLAHYRLASPLGAGSMGVVYRARDLHLERDVALKLLPEGALADETARRRFRREALALSFTLTWLGYAHAVGGRRDSALRVLEQLEHRSRREFVQPYFFAILHAGFGDRDRVFARLERGVELRCEEMCDGRNDPAMDLIRSDPRYRGILRRLGFAGRADADDSGRKR